MFFDSDRSPLAPRANQRVARGRLLAACLILVGLASAAPAWAGYRPFTFTYDTYPMPKGGLEFEQWVTYEGHKEEDSDFTRFDFREEIELGLADNFRLGLYLPRWRYEDSDDRTGTRFVSVGVEGILLLSNPVTDALGVGLYSEINVGEHELEFEHKLLLQKDWGNWTVAYNLVVETEVEGIGTDEDSEVEGVLGHTLGVSYGLTPEWRIGGEIIVESVYENWHHYEDTTVYAGPVLSYQGGQIGNTNTTWWVTVTPVMQLTDNDGEPDFKVRLLAGLEF